MTKYNGLISNFLQGVSKQPDIQRLDGQVSEQINCRSSIIDGLTRRPCSEIVGFSNSDADAQYYHYSRGDGLEKYLFKFIQGVLFVYDLETGEQKTVTQASSSYLDGNLNFCTVKDTTFVVNTDKIVTTGTRSPAYDTYEYLIYAKKVSYGITYTVKIKPLSGESITASIRTMPSTVNLASDTMNKQLTLDTKIDLINNVYSDLVNFLNSQHPTATINQYDNIIHITSEDPLDITVHDGNGDTEFFCVHKEINKVTDLPKQAPHDYKVKVIGNDKDKENDYYLKFVADDGSGTGPGHWKETIGWNEVQNLSSESMPHKIIREADGTFTISDIEWVDRLVGDEDSNPLPSFQGNKILSVLVYQNRLVLSTSNTVCASCTDDYFNFFAPSVIQSADSDPIDATSSGNNITDLRHMFVFNGSLVIVGRESQYIHQSDTAFDSKHFALIPKINYLTTLSCKPKTSVNSIYLPYSYGKYTGIRTLGMNELTGNMIGEELTNYVNTYLEGTCEQIEVTANHSTAFVRTSDYPGLYIYQWYKRGDQLLQQAWHKWEFPEYDSIKYIAIIDNYLYIIGSSSHKYFIISRINIEGNLLNYSDIPIHLDFVEEHNAIEFSDTYEIEFYNSYFKDYTLDELYIILSNNFKYAGKHLVKDVDYFIPDGSLNLIQVYKDRVPLITGDPIFYIGLPFTSSLCITNPNVKDYQGKPKIVNKLKLERIYLTLEDTGYLDVNITKYSNTIKHTFTGKVIGSSNLILNGPVPITDYIFKTSVREKVDNVSIEFSSDTYLPFRIINMAWTGTYKDKGRRTL